MKIFLSWSGAQSHAVAHGLFGWLPSIFPGLTLFFSSEIEKGAKWGEELDSALEGTRFAIICLTPENLRSEWIHFEAGALSKFPDARIWTLLTNLRPVDVAPPLSRFQATNANRDDILRLVRSINAQLGQVGGSSWIDDRLAKLFDVMWPELDLTLQAAAAMVTPADQVKEEGRRAESEIFAEVLERLRALSPSAGGSARDESDSTSVVGSLYTLNRYDDVTVRALRVDLDQSTPAGQAFTKEFSYRVPQAEFKLGNMHGANGEMGAPCMFVNFEDSPLSAAVARKLAHEALTKAGIPNQMVWVYERPADL
jgi:hypothetical protein